MNGYTDFLLKTPDLQTAAQSLAALKAGGYLAAGDGPDNMLGDTQSVTVGGTTLTIRARKGIAAANYTDPQGATVQVPARGDPTLWYIAIRTSVVSADPIDPATYGLTVCDPVESAAVLGVWA